MTDEKPAWQGYRQLEVWQRAVELAKAVYALTEQLPPEERFGLTSQMQRAVVSIAANIAEGYGRTHRGDYLRHLSFARGSLMELETLITIAVQVGRLNRDAAKDVWPTAQSVGKMLTKLIRSLETSTG